MKTETQPQQLGRYGLERVIGEGQTSRVYSARDDGGRKVALKLMRPEILEHGQARARFHREARAMMAIEHDNVISLFDYSGPDAKAPFIAMEMLRGRTLAALVEERGGLPDAIVAALFAQVASGLAAAHTQKLLHRDLSLNNLFVEDSGRVVVSDFGLAAAVRGALTSETFVTRATDIVGTPLFFAPEVLREQKYSEASDLYALGVAMTFCLLGKPPGPSHDIAQLLAAILDNTLVSLRQARPKTEPSLLAIIEAMCAANRGARPESADQVHAALLPLAASRRELADWLGVEAQTRVQQVVAHEHTIAQAFQEGDLTRAISVASEGRYRVGNMLGEGGMARVYGAYDQVLKQNVAIKILLEASPEQRLRFHREARALGRLRHENIVRLFDYSGRDAPLPFLVLERIEGATLEAVLALKPLSETAALVIGERVAKALAAAHAQDIIHRDIKPDNVFVDSEGRVLLSDFGIARGVAQEGTFAVRKTRAVGTPLYASPEQLHTPDAVGPASDLFSLGSLLHGLIAGRAPLSAKSLSGVLAQIQDGEFVGLPKDTGADFTALLTALHQKDPAKRPKSADAVAAEIRAMLDRRGVRDAQAVIVEFFGLEAAPAPQTVAVTTSASRRRWPLALVMGVAGLAIGGLSVRRWLLPQTEAVEQTVEQTVVETPTPSPLAAPAEPAPPPTLPPPTLAPPAALPVVPVEPPRAAKKTEPKPGKAIAPTQAVVTPATLRFFTKPWANISIDGRPIGATPIVNSTELPPGVHVVRFEHPGFASVEQRVELKNGEARDVHVNLNR